jgi:hypothetical protein
VRRWEEREEAADEESRGHYLWEKLNIAERVEYDLIDLYSCSQL